MNFVSLSYFLFFPAAVLLYLLFPAKYRWIPLLAASCFFYACQDARVPGLLLAVVLATYLCGRRMEGAHTKKGRRAALIFAASVCFGSLFLFKYLSFTADCAAGLLRLCGAEVSFRWLPAGFLPIGISFYVFQTMSYVIDVYRGRAKAERHLGYYALFAAFFPQLVSGPLERPEDLLPRLKAAPTPRAEDVSEGLRLCMRGYGKKILIADYLADFVDAGYGSVSTAGGAALSFATVLFAVQIYCDFSGYSDIAAGCARCMGIRLSDNFRNPYGADSIRDFWRRWHITLTRWFTDYLYIPLGGSRGGRLRRCRNILATFLVSGLWHGANWTFVLWGGLHGFYLIIETLLSGRRKNVVITTGKYSIAIKFIRQSVTFLLVCFAWIFFRSATPADSFRVVRAIFTDWRGENLLPALGMNRTSLSLALLSLSCLPVLDRLPSLRLTAPLPSETHRRYHAALMYFLLLMAVFLCRCLVLTEQGGTAFLYFQF